MSIVFTPFDKQEEFLLDNSKIRVLIAAKRSGKSESCYIDTILKAEKQPGYKQDGKDPYIIGIIAPTENMLRRLVFPKFRQFAKPFEADFNKQDQIMKWRGKNSLILGFTGEKITRMEGYKLNHVYMTEAFQLSEHAFFESLARTSDTGGTITIEGSLGTNFNNPKSHWIYKTFIEKPFEGSKVWQWATTDNPHFPKEQLELLKEQLDPRTYRQLFTIDWDVPGTNLVYDQFDSLNLIKGYTYNPNWETSVSIDWGWAHPMAVTFWQFDRLNGICYCFDEIVSSRLTLDELHERIITKPYKYNNWYCDIAGNQEREQTGMSNIRWFEKKGIKFKYRRSAVNYGITLVRQFIRDGKGRVRLLIDESKCPKTLDGMRNYSYQEKDGVILNENPVKKDDDTVDSLRYYLVNRHDSSRMGAEMTEFNRFGTWKFPQGV